MEFVDVVLHRAEHPHKLVERRLRFLGKRVVDFARPVDKTPPFVQDTLRSDMSADANPTAKPLTLHS